MAREIDLVLERSWRERLRRFQGSGLSVRQFCRNQGVREHTFFWWRRQLAKRDRLQSDRSAARRSHQVNNRRRVNGVSGSRSRLERSQPAPAFVPVHLITEPLTASCMEFRIGTAFLRVPTTVDERTLRQAIRVLREEAAAC